MLNQILAGTPIWVWGILAFLLYRGFIASKDRTVSLKSLCIMPLVMLGLSIQGMLTNFGLTTLAWTSWGLAYLVVTAIAWKSVSAKDLRILKAQSQIYLRGSWLPLILMMAIFIIKYSINVMLSIDPQRQTQTLFITAVGLVFGILNGMFMGKMLGILVMYAQTKQLPAHSPIHIGRV